MSRFADQVRRLGGSVRKCEPRHLPAEKNVQATRTSGCGDMALALLPYPALEPATEAWEQAGHALVCANCDHADEFPRVRTA